MLFSLDVKLRLFPVKWLLIVNERFTLNSLGWVNKYFAMWLRCGYRFESCDANGPRNVKNQKLAKKKALLIFSLCFMLVVRNRSWRCLNEGNFTLRFVWHLNVVTRVSKMHSGNGRYRGETCAVRCAVDSEALRRNWPLRKTDLVGSTYNQTSMLKTSASRRQLGTEVCLGLESRLRSGTLHTGCCLRREAQILESLSLSNDELLLASRSSERSATC